MKINYTYQEIAKITDAEILAANNNEQVKAIHFDSRRIFSGQGGVFLCLKSENQNGHDYIPQAYAVGVRTFLIDQEIDLTKYPKATFLRVTNTMTALQTWAAAHRAQFDCEVIAVTGSAGKTVIKEWLYSLLNPLKRINRSPKSYNSQLGVALSLFEMDEQTEIAIIEAGISHPGEMEQLAKMIQPTLGVLTSFSKNHRENFASESQHLTEKLKLFKSCRNLILPKAIDGSTELDYLDAQKHFVAENENLVTFNKALLKLTLTAINIEVEENHYDHLPTIALRMETLEGVRENTIVVDAFIWSQDGLEQALSYQSNIQNKKRVLVCDPEELMRVDELALTDLLARFDLKYDQETNGLRYFSNFEVLGPIENSSILFKGNSSKLKRGIIDFKKKNHVTVVEIQLDNLSHNLKFWKNRAGADTKILAMVKASSYGAELERIGHFFSQKEIDYLGVAYADEGIELRNQGISLPIIVMNSDVSSWNDMIANQLQPSIYSMDQLDSFVKELIYQDVQQYPIHIKVDTGMKRLGFEKTDKQSLLSFLHAQPEVKVMSLFSHLSDADNADDTSFTHHQYKEFITWKSALEESLSYSFDCHLLNSEGFSRFADYKMDMVRLGIGIYGITLDENLSKKLKPVLSWKSSIAQTKTLKKGDFLGYGRKFVADKDMQIGIVSVGYADGLDRKMGNQNGQLFINGKGCTIIGNVCMDMCMVDLGGLKISLPQEVEIIGKHQKIEEIAKICQTIPYEIMTGLSRRMPRIYIEEED